MPTALAQRILSQRYHQRDLADIRRTAARWWTMLDSQVTGLSEPEAALRDACSLILSRVRKDALGSLKLVSPQMSFDEVDAA